VSLVESGQDDSFAEEVELRSAVHLALDGLDPVDVAFDLAGAVGQSEPGGDGITVAADPDGE
jgi:hypothetical protein